MYTNIDHAKGLNAVSVALQFRCHLYDGIMQLLELALKITIFSLMAMTSMGRDWTPQYADIYMANLRRRPYIKQL